MKRFRVRSPRVSLVRGSAILGLVFLAAAAGAQPRERTLRVSALDKEGDPVERLTPSDVVVREDDRAREVLRVTRATEPMQIAVLVDNSASTSPYITDMREGLRAFLEAIGPGNELSLVTYADRPTLLTSFSKSPAEFEKGIGRLFAQPNSGAYLLEAILETSQGFIKREAPRPVIVVVGTEGVEFSNSGYEQVLERLHESGAQLHVLQLVDQEPDRTQEERYRSIVIDRGTRETGGRRDNLLASLSLPNALRSLAVELKSQFDVVYSRPESLIPPRDVEVSSARPDLEVRGMLVRDAGLK
jgi:VWFA-related protein